MHIETETNMYDMTYRVHVCTKIAIIGGHHMEGKLIDSFEQVGWMCLNNNTPVRMCDVVSLLLLYFSVFDIHEIVLVLWKNFKYCFVVHVVYVFPGSTWIFFL